MDGGDLTLVEDIDIDKLDESGRRVSLETPATLRENKRASRVYLNGRLRELRKISKKALKGHSIASSSPDEEADIEPLQMGQRTVLRSRVRLSVRKFKDIHAIYRKDSADATILLKSTRHPHLGWYPFDRSAIRVEFEEHQKVTTQMSRLFPVDSGLTRRAQELCEQVSEVHGVPNDVETELLGDVGHVGDEVIEKWFNTKATRLKAHRVAISCRQRLLVSARIKNFQKLPKPSSSGDSDSKFQQRMTGQVQNPERALGLMQTRDSGV